jgi:hypothetical protein
MIVAVLDDLVVPDGVVGLDEVAGLDKVAGRASFAGTYLLLESLRAFSFIPHALITNITPTNLFLKPAPPTPHSRQSRHNSAP